VLPLTLFECSVLLLLAETSRRQPVEPSHVEPDEAMFLKQSTLDGTGLTESKETRYWCPAAATTNPEDP